MTTQEGVLASKILSPEKQAQILHQVCREMELDGHIKTLNKKSDAHMWTEQRAVQCGGLCVPVKNSYMYCNALDMCFFFDKGGNASLAYSGVTNVSNTDITRGDLVRAFEFAAKILARMQELANKS